MFFRAPHRILPGLALAAALWPAHANAQAGSAVAGTLAGAVEGTYLSLALATASARAGHYVFTPRQALWQLTPIPLLAIGGGTLGYHDAGRLRDAARYGLAGLAAGAFVGAALGAVTGDDREAPWAGAIVGGGVGLLAGNLWGALRDRGDSDVTILVPVVILSIPFAP